MTSTLFMTETEVLNPQLVEVLNDLVAIQNDRILGYENALKDITEKNQDLKPVFNKHINTSRIHIIELGKSIAANGGTVEKGTTITGKIYRAWMDIKAAFTGKDRESILESCIFGEEAAQKAYQMAVESNANMSTDMRQLLRTQKMELASQQATIMALEEMAEA